MAPGKNLSWITSILPKALAWIAKPLYYRAHIKPLLYKADKHLTKKYNKNVLEKPSYRITNNPASPEYSHGYYRIYIPPSELLRAMSENREAMILQAHIKHSLVPDLSIVDKNLHEAVCVNETTEIIASTRNPIRKLRLYRDQIQQKNKNNDYIEAVQYADEKKQLKPAIENIGNELKKATKKSPIIPSTTKERLRRRINVQKNKWKKEVDDIVTTLETATDKQLIDSASKLFHEYGHKYTADEVVRSIATKKPLKANDDGDVLSYVSIAEVVYDNPRISGKGIANRLGKSELPYIQYGIVALLNTNEKGLNLIERRKMGGAYRYFPTQHFRDLLKKHNYKAYQKELTDYKES